MFAFIRSFFKPSLSGITASITKQSAKLKQLVDTNNAEVDQNNTMIAALQVDNNNLSNESAKASRIAGRLDDLVA